MNYKIEQCVHEPVTITLPSNPTIGDSITVQKRTSYVNVEIPNKYCLMMFRDSDGIHFEVNERPSFMAYQLNDRSTYYVAG